MNANFRKDDSENEHDYSKLFPQNRKKLRILPVSNFRQNKPDKHDYNYIFPESDYRNNSSDTKAQFTYVRQLIKQKRYDIARRELTKIDHAKADDWLRKLDRIDPTHKLSLFEVKLNVLEFFFFLIVVVLLVYIADLGNLDMATTISSLLIVGFSFMGFCWLRNRI